MLTWLLKVVSPRRTRRARRSEISYFNPSCLRGEFRFYPLFIHPGAAQPGAPWLEIAAAVGDEVFHMVTKSKKARRETDREDRQILHYFGDHLFEQRAPFILIDLGLSFAQE